MKVVITSLEAAKILGEHMGKTLNLPTGTVIDCDHSVEIESLGKAKLIRDEYIISWDETK